VLQFETHHDGKIRLWFLVKLQLLSITVFTQLVKGHKDGGK